MTRPATPSVGDVADDGFAVTPDNDGVFDPVPRALWIGTGGDVAVRTKRGTALTLTNVPDGTLLPLSVDQVKATGTTAQDIVALY